MSTTHELHWAPRVRRATILRLYERAALGIADTDLIDEVAFALYVRCESILTVTAAAAGRVKCPRCGHLIVHQARKEDLIRCEPCGWAVRWGEYFTSYHRKQLHGGGGIDEFREAVTTFPVAAKSPATLLLWIDKLIHECHKGIRGAHEEQRYTRPMVVNLMEGTMQAVIRFLEQLPYGPGSHPAMREQLVRWRQNVLSALPDWKQAVQGTGPSAGATAGAAD